MKQFFLGRLHCLKNQVGLSGFRDDFAFKTSHDYISRAAKFGGNLSPIGVTWLLFSFFFFYSEKSRPLNRFSGMLDSSNELVWRKKIHFGV
jgi:hypothetical protein